MQVGRFHPETPQLPLTGLAAKSLPKVTQVSRGPPTRPLSDIRYLEDLTGTVGSLSVWKHH